MYIWSGLMFDIFKLKHSTVVSTCAMYLTPKYIREILVDFLPPNS